jgi:hypothetical protein
MQELKALLVQEAIADLRAELLVRAWERERLLEALVNGLASNSSTQMVDLSLPSRLTEAVARLQGRPALALTAVPTPEEPLQPEFPPVPLPSPEEQATAETLELPPPTETNAEVDRLVEDALVAKIKELRQQDPPVAWTAIAGELGITEHGLRKLRQEHGL